MRRRGGEDRCESVDVALIVQQQFGSSHVTVMSRDVQRRQLVLHTSKTTTVNNCSCFVPFRFSSTWIVASKTRRTGAASPLDSHVKKQSV